MMKKFFLISAAAAVVALVAVVAMEPVPFTVTCFDPDRAMRNLCQRQVAIMKTQMHLRSLQFADPVFLRENRERILQDYEKSLEQGLDPAEVGMEPAQLRRMIDDIIRQRLGESV